jgi:glycine cleavage system H protein
VVEVNDGLSEAPESVNEDCYGEGWMLTLAIEDPSEFDALLDASAYAQHVKERSD